MIKHLALSGRWKEKYPVLGPRESVLWAQHERCNRLAKMLAWAVERDIPILDVLKHLSLSIPQATLRFALGNFILGPILLLPFATFLAPIASFLVSPSAVFQASLEMLIADLKKGKPLGESLRQRMQRHLPAWYLAAVEAAEKSGTLKQVLPQLARDLRASDTPRLWRLSLASLVFILSILAGWAILTSLGVGRMLNRIGPYLSDGTLSFRSVVLGLLAVAIPLLLTVLVLYVVYSSILRWGQRARSSLHLPTANVTMENIFVEFVKDFPLVRKVTRRKSQVALLRYFEYAFRFGMTFPHAIEWIAESARKTWIRKQLIKLTQTMQDGSAWNCCWLKAMDDPNGVNWIIINGAAREDLAATFCAAADSAQESAIHFERCHKRRSAFCLLVLEILIVSLAVLHFYGMLYDVLLYTVNAWA